MMEIKLCANMGYSTWDWPIQDAKWVSGLDKVDVEKLFVRDVNGGKGHSLKLFKKYFRDNLDRGFLRI